MGFAYRAGALCAESVPLAEIARRFGTPCYVYSRTAIEHAYGEFCDALAGVPALVAYSVKANSNLAVLALLARRGAGFDIVSGGELARVRAAGGDLGRVLFSGVGKSEGEIVAAIEAGILCLNLESEAEMERVAAIAERMGKRAPVAFRVNPEVDASTHPYIATALRESKFGVPYEQAERLCREAARRRSLALIGVGFHIGSQVLAVEPYVQAALRARELVERLEAGGLELSHIDVGGGFGIRYRDEAPPAIAETIGALRRAFAGRRERLVVDPGRAIVGPAGVLLTRVEYVKPGRPRRYVVVDAAMNDLLRPALYGAWHEVRPIRESAGGEPSDVVGPVCESGDFLALDRRLDVRAGDLLALADAGAYGMTMSSNYNSRPRPAELLVDGARVHLVRPRESLEALYACESVPEF